MEFEWSVERNQARSFLMQTSALLSILVRVIGKMIKVHLWYVINTDQGCWLNDKGVPSEYHRV